MDGFAFMLASVVAVLASPSTAAAAPPAETAAIHGVVRDRTTGHAIEGAVALLQCTCLSAAIEIETDHAGIYRFDALPPGVYDLTVIAGRSMTTKTFSLPAAAEYRAGFAVDPDLAETIELMVDGVVMRPARELVAPARDFTFHFPCQTVVPRCSVSVDGSTHRLSRSLFDNGGRCELLGGPAVTRRLF